MLKNKSYETIAGGKVWVHLKIKSSLLSFFLKISCGSWTRSCATTNVTALAFTTLIPASQMSSRFILLVGIKDRWERFDSAYLHLNCADLAWLTLQNPTSKYESNDAALTETHPLKPSGYIPMNWGFIDHKAAATPPWSIGSHFQNPCREHDIIWNLVEK